MANANNAPVGFKLGPSPAEAEFELNIGGANPKASTQFGSQLIRRSQRVAKGVYDFAVQGGAIGNVNLYDAIYAPGISSLPGLAQIGPGSVQKGVFKPLILPYNAIVTRAVIDVLTAFTGAGASVAFSSGVTAADVKAATAIASLTGLVETLLLNTAASSIKVVQPVAGVQGVIPFAAISAVALTGGKCNVHFEYYLSD